MSFWDNVKKFTQPYADDDYDDYDEDEEETVDHYEEPEERPARRPSRRSSAPAPVQEEPQEPAAEEDDFGFGAAPLMSSGSSSLSGSGFSGQVLNMSSAGSVSNKQEVVLFRPNSFNDTSKAADDLRSHKAVIVNMENGDKAMARRVVDFLSGCVYALDGDVKKIAQSAYLFCPHNMDIAGDLESIQAEVESYM